MLLGGLWHGASWNFVAWGGLHGLFLATERWLIRRSGRRSRTTLASRICLGLLTYLLVNVTWVMFRAQDFPTAWRLLGAMTGIATGDEAVLPFINIVFVATVIPLMLVVHWLMRDRSLETVVRKTPWWLTATAWAGMLFAVIATQGSGDAFIYFQF
jgi:alginate O-acetyltransferase complex protein AlgI